MAEQMKPSGIDWIGEIPCSWNIKRIKYLAQLKGRIGWQGLTSDEYTDVGPFLITGVDFSDGGINWGSCVHITEERWAEAPEIHIKNGDLLITKDGTVGKVAIVENLQGKASLNSGVLLIKTSDEYNKKFLYWALLSEEFWTWFRLKNAGNSTIIHLYQNDFAEFSYTFPGITEQNAIADFLDKECAQIDDITADLEKQIALLQQYKKSLITETVTKGLDKSAPMKDSGNSIIGSINCCYTTKKLKYIVETPITDGPHETPALVDDGIPFLSAESVKNGILDFEYKRGYISESDHKFFCKKIKPQKNDVFIVKSGATTGNVGIVTVDQEFSIWSPLALIRCDDKTVLQKFIYYCVSSNYFKHEIEQAWSYGTQQNIGMGVIENLTVVIPPIDEQKRIVHYLDDVLASMDEMIIDKTKQLEIIQQHKKSLIYEYVTGKKRVKEVR